MDVILNNSSGQPFYEQIQEQVKRLIQTGQLQEGEALPSMRQLAKELRVSVITTKRAYEELEQAGYLCSVAGKGSFAGRRQDEADQDALRLEALLEKLRELVAELRYLNVTTAELMAVVEGGLNQ